MQPPQGRMGSWGKNSSGLGVPAAAEVGTGEVFSQVQVIITFSERVRGDCGLLVGRGKLRVNQLTGKARHSTTSTVCRSSLLSRASLLFSSPFYTDAASLAVQDFAQSPPPISFLLAFPSSSRPVVLPSFLPSFLPTFLSFSLRGSIARVYLEADPVSTQTDSKSSIVQSPRTPVIGGLSGGQAWLSAMLP